MHKFQKAMLDFPKRIASYAATEGGFFMKFCYVFVLLF